MASTYEDPPTEQIAPGRSTGRDWAIAAGLLLGLLGLYHLNGDFLPGNDATPNVYLPLQVLGDGSLSFTPEGSPSMFMWTLHGSGTERVVRVRSWDQPADAADAAAAASIRKSGTPHVTWGQLYGRGKLRLRQPEYYLVPSIDPVQRGYVNQYGPGAGLTALVPFAVISRFAGDLGSHPALLWYGGKFVAALCVAASAAVIFLALAGLAGRTAALVIAAAYGAGTCAWSLASQTLWQSGPNVLFLALAAYCLLRIERSAWWAAGCGAAIGWAVICRPTSALVALAIGGYLVAGLVKRWRAGPDRQSARKAAGALAAYLLAGLPFAVALGAYNTYYLGAPWRFGQTEAAKRLAEAQLGTPNAWAGSFLEGFYGLLVSPSRGMLVYSPILVFAVWGMFRLWREPRLEKLRPLSVAVLLLLVVQAKWFNWHGGWSFGYRLMVDATPLLALCAASVAVVVWRQKVLLGVFAVLLAWSVGVQVIGAYAYNVVGWNCRQGLLVQQAGGGAAWLVFDPRLAARLAKQEKATVRRVALDVDRRVNHRRLWSIRDSQLLYYLARFTQSRRVKRELIERVLRPP
jgi:hypothetical protein